MKIKLLIIGILGMMMCSCSSVKHTAATADVSTKIVNFTVADLDVSPTKVSKTYYWNFNPFKSENVSLITSNVTAQILQETVSDVLVERQIIVEKRGFLRGGSVTVIGFPAKYSNFHKMTHDEAKIFESVKGDSDDHAKNKKRFLIF